MSTFYDCSGCALCALVCPLWQQNMNISLLPWGRAKAVQGGAEAADIKESLEACLNCGACEPICPEKIDIHKEDTRFNLQLKAESAYPLFNLNASRLILDQTNEVQKSWYFKVKGYIHEYAKKNEVIVDDATKYRALLNENKKLKVFGLGDWLIQKRLIQAKMQKEDLYWIDAPLFHSRYEQLVRVYDTFKKSTQCNLNWNLQRTAMPLGQDTSYFDRKKQYDLITFNKPIQRIVAENYNDWLWLKEHSPYPVLHVTELLGEA
ncbi:MAG: (Fe-S)-binding protein [Bdellovibrionota bacterium]